MAKRSRKHSRKKGMSETNIKKALGVKILPTEVFNAVRHGVWLNTFEINKTGSGSGYALIFPGSVDLNLPAGVIASSDKRGDMVSLRNNLVEDFQRHLDLVKEDLDNDWGVKVRNRDGNKCILCGNAENLTAHHWCRLAHKSGTARWVLVNGVCLCYGCHIPLAHKQPDWLLLNQMYRHVQGMVDEEAASNGNAPYDVGDMVYRMSEVKATDYYIRGLWFKRGLHVPEMPPALAEVECCRP